MDHTLANQLFGRGLPLFFRKAGLPQIPAKFWCLFSETKVWLARLARLVVFM